MPNFFGLEFSLGKILPGGFDPSKVITTNTDASQAAPAASTAPEQISLTIAAVVTQVLPNGNLVIQGSQEMQDQRRRAPADRRRHRAAGGHLLVQHHPHTQIAEARINYGGRGDIASVQKTPAGTALLQRFWPF